MSYGAGGEDQPVPPGGMLASEAERERTLAVLKQAFEDQRLTQDEFESRVGSAISARTLDQLAALTRDLPAPLPVSLPATRRPRRTWLLIAHPEMAAGLRDAVRRMAVIDPAS